LKKDQQKELEYISEALFTGYQDGIYWEYKNPYTEGSILWVEYYYGYLIGLLLPQEEQA